MHYKGRRFTNSWLLEYQSIVITKRVFIYKFIRENLTLYKIFKQAYASTRGKMDFRVQRVGNPTHSGTSRLTEWSINRTARVGLIMRYYLWIATTIMEKKTN